LLLLFQIEPLLLNIVLNGSFAGFEGLLGFTFVGNIAHKHLRFEGLDHVLLVVQVAVGLLDLLATELVLVVLLLGVNIATRNLYLN
jgi:hypothetical protein